VGSKDGPPWCPLKTTEGDKKAFVDDTTLHVWHQNHLIKTVARLRKDPSVVALTLVAIESISGSRHCRSDKGAER
jgi:hypothetical protein